MRNPRLTARERSLIKGALRRVFARSDLRQEVLETVSIIAHFDRLRPRVKNWSICPKCSTRQPRYLFVVDHIEPVIPIETSLEEMSWDDVIDRLWCDKSNLDPICKECHHQKTKHERKQRSLRKKIDALY